jgi:hypothetical protein
MLPQACEKINLTLGNRLNLLFVSRLNHRSRRAVRRLDHRRGVFAQEVEIAATRVGMDIDHRQPAIQLLE